MDKIKNDISSLEQMKAYISVCCIKQEQHTKIIKQKLKKKFNASNEDIDEIIKWLKSIKILDDEKFTNAFIHDKIFLNKWGINKVIAALRYRNISDEIIMKSVINIDQEKYFNIAKNVFENILKNEKDQIKITKKMACRGFQYHIISQLLTENTLDSSA